MITTMPSKARSLGSALGTIPTPRSCGLFGVSTTGDSSVYQQLSHRIQCSYIITMHAMRVIVCPSHPSVEFILFLYRKACLPAGKFRTPPWGVHSHNRPGANAVIADQDGQTLPFEDRSLLFRSYIAANRLFLVPGVLGKQNDRPLAQELSPSRIVHVYTGTASRGDGRRRSNIDPGEVEKWLIGIKAAAGLFSLFRV
jgi:hypothetical protein